LLEESPRTKIETKKRKILVRYTPDLCEGDKPNYREVKTTQRENYIWKTKKVDDRNKDNVEAGVQKNPKCKGGKEKGVFLELRWSSRTPILRRKGSNTKNKRRTKAPSTNQKETNAKSNLSKRGQTRD